MIGISAVFAVCSAYVIRSETRLPGVVVLALTNYEAKLQGHDSIDIYGANFTVAVWFRVDCSARVVNIKQRWSGSVTFHYFPPFPPSVIGKQEAHQLVGPGKRPRH